jgi:hypothetical protein
VKFLHALVVVALAVTTGACTSSSESNSGVTEHPSTRRAPSKQAEGRPPSETLSAPSGETLHVVVTADQATDGDSESGSETDEAVPGTSPASLEAEMQPAARRHLGAQCASCHAEIVDAYAESGMSQTWREVHLPLLGSLEPVPTVADRRSGYFYHVMRHKDSIYQVERRADQPDHQLIRQADYLVGSGKHAQAMVTNQSGYLSQLPVAWFREENTWKLNPGFELKNHRFQRPITPGCVACHATAADHEPLTTNRFRGSVQAGIDCRRCHGEFDRHLAYWQDGDQSLARETARMFHPGEVTADRANDLCLQCHLQGDITVFLEGSSPLDFLPGDDLRSHRHDFLIAHEQPESLGVASHGARMLQSRCYTASGGQLTCIHCHDAHHAVEKFRPEYYDSRCLSCHTSEACSRTRANAIAETRNESSCVGCHMPQRSSREGIHLVFTDHAISRRPSQPSATPDVFPRLDENVELVSAWPAMPERPHRSDAGILGTAYVLLHESMGPHPTSLQRGRQLLANAAREEPHNAENQYWLAAAQLGLQRPSEALPLFERLLQVDRNRHATRYRLGLTQEALGNSTEAMKHYQVLLDEVPGWLEPYKRLAPLQLFLNQPQAAALTLQKQLAQHDSAPGYAQLALAERMRGTSHASAVQLIERSLALDPRLPEAYVNRGILHLLNNQQLDARRDFQQALQFDPNNSKARQALEALKGNP